VLGAAGRPVASGGVSLRLPRSEGSFNLPFSAPIGPEGRFTLTNVDPGEYRLNATTALASGSLSVRVGPGEVVRVVVQTAPGPLLTGRVLVDGLPASVNVARMPIAVHALRDDGTPTGGTVSARVQADGRFVLPNVPRLGMLRVQGSPPGTALQSVLLGGMNVTDGFDARQSELSGIEVHLTTRPPRVAGGINEPPGMRECEVILFSVDPVHWTTAWTRRVIAVRSNFEGTFRTADLPPGDYLAVAVPRLDRNQWADPERLERLRSVATPFTLTDGVTTSITLRIQQ
jgi:hypothetical protein